MKDLFDKFDHKGPLGQYQDVAHGYFSFPKLEGELGPRMTFRGKECIIWSINSYLGITNHPEVRKADAEAAADYGMAYPMGARIMSGETDAHLQLEKELAEFTQKEDALLLNFGYQGIMSIVDACLSRHDVVVYDRDDHACIMDGIRMHQGPKYAFKHNDIDHFLVRMEQAKKEAEKRNSGILVITEGVFGMRGEQGILKEICEYKEKYGFRLLVDDAHGFGTMGATGAGAGEEQGVQDQIDVYFSTFAKAMSGFGAFVSADKSIIDFFRYNLRSQVFAKSLCMPMVKGALTRLRLLREHPELREDLWRNVNMLQKGLRDAGFDIGNTGACVTPVFMKGTPYEAGALIYDMRENYGIFCSIVLPPVIPKGQLILRLIPTAEHTVEDIETTLAAFREVRTKLEDGTYAKMAEMLAQGVVEGVIQ
ncbi:pyridoxal phosphate-dependent aminotransferase family protein [Lewinella sp. 4G2]|uniref:aminotransferase class I/II-fold pyridoxal phosphate-dependent enzyme n=1 Tax=Lewinella sp. 4G2 TaxID=1803372 RepID=UPI0007B4C0B5|nr:pyridoxal phosphate-dependent aminotransferase family protein [Lewinella sp. 4G2]OAV43483.1 8-amino-7-oxononanoate synthase [Lewinella sp. 4G2]